jgi:hypothetical protein
VLVFLHRFSLPLLDGAQSLDRFAFVSHDGIFSKAPGQGLRIALVLGGNIDGDGFWKFRNHIEIYRRG